MELLREHAITPKELFFVRNNQTPENAKTLKPLPVEGWIIAIDGLVQRPAVVNAADLSGMAQQEVEMVMQCSGNGRSFFASYSVKTNGTQWKNGGMGVSSWKGVPLHALMERLETNPVPAAKFLTANGVDEPPITGGRPDFEHSVPLDVALERAILAIEMNGEPIPAVHGGPVRLIIPGFYGTMNVKWWRRLTFAAHETKNCNQIPRYRTPNSPIEPGSSIDYTFENSTPNWQQEVKSVFFTPLDGEAVEAGQVTLQGGAWNGGDVPVTVVAVYSDLGANWRRPDLVTPASTYSWYRWSLNVDSGARDYF